jgi:hypothetical protein
MSTNFYLRDSKLYADCKQFASTYNIYIEPPGIHIAKTSGGWKPMFQSNTLFSSVAELKAFYLANNLDIFDEYDNVYSWEQFTERVLEYADELNNKPHTNVTIDSEGYEFRNGEWS